jgi:hypothetical protein
MRETESQGTGKDRANCMRQFNEHGIDQRPPVWPISPLIRPASPNFCK